MANLNFLPAINEILCRIRRKESIDQVVDLILAKACEIAHARHGSFALVDYQARRLSISNVFGSDWTLEKKLCQLELGRGLTGHVAVTGVARLCRDTLNDPDYYPLFDYVRSELVVPVMVNDRVWGVINIDEEQPDAFDSSVFEMLIVFGELAAAAITLRLEMSDQERLYRKLLQSEKLASLGEALAGIAHEINNPLTSVLCHTSLLASEPGVDEGRRRTAEIVASEAQRAANLVRSLLEFSRKETGVRQTVDAHQMVQAVVDLKRYQFRMAGVRLIFARTTDSCLIQVCPQQIKQVLLNLFTNAEQALVNMSGTGVVRVSVERVGPHVRIVVADNGPGVPEECRALIFDPFFTTKAPGEGTGLGLSISHTIIEAHGGSLQLAEPKLASGAAFEIELPAAAPVPALLVEPPAEWPNSTLPATGSGGHSGRVLIVDDEPHIIEALCAYLARKQFEVRTAGGASAALDLLNREQFDVVLTDVRMPGMTGLDLHAAATRRQPRYQRRFVFMSGYLLRADVKAHLAATGLPCIEKPFSFDELQRELARHLHTLAA